MGGGYIGGIVLLLILFVGFINPEVGWLGTTSENGMDIRSAVLVSAVWVALFVLPVLIAVPESRPSNPRARLGLLESYRQLFTDVATLWRERRPTLQFLLASAVFRDGLAGVFTFGAVIASGTFGFTASGVILFAIAANVVAGLATFLGGYLDDKLGPKTIIVASLTGLVVSGVAVFALHDGGQTVFWVFGLYATTGRAASFLAPLFFAVSITVGGAQYWGILGITVVVGAGLLLLLPIQAGMRPIR